MSSRFVIYFTVIFSLGVMTNNILEDEPILELRATDIPGDEGPDARQPSGETCYEGPSGVVCCDDDEELVDGECLPVCDEDERLAEGRCETIECDEDERLAEGRCDPEHMAVL